MREANIQCREGGNHVNKKLFQKYIHINFYIKS